jgi:hypothetical protein
MAGRFFLYPFQPGQIVTLKKAHPCGGKTWTILRVGLDVTLSCNTCSHIMILERKALEKACTQVTSP